MARADTRTPTSPAGEVFVPYVFLVVAVLAEVVGTSLLKATDGFTRLWPTVGVGISYAVAFFFLARVVQYIPVGVTYALWSGLGTAAIAAIGATFLGEPLSLTSVVGIALIVAGVVVLNLSGAH